MSMRKLPSAPVLLGAMLLCTVLALTTALPDGAAQATVQRYALGSGIQLTVAEVPRQRLSYRVLETTVARAELTPLGGRLTARQPLSALAAVGGPGVLAAVNGDFFDIVGSGVPLGPVIRDGQVLKASAVPVKAVGTDPRGRLRQGRVRLGGAVAVAGTPHRLDCLNCRSLKPGFAVYTPDWGSAPRPVRSPGPVRQLTVSAGRVVDVRDRADNSSVPEDGFVLVAVGPAATALAAVRAGAPASFKAGQAGGGSPWELALGYRGTLLRKGEIPRFPGTHWYETREPRTALGWDGTGRRLWLLTVDGRSSHAAGLTVAGTARLLKRLGAANAVMLDGGGSTQMMARTGPAALRTVNVPSGHQERPVPNGLALVAPVTPVTPVTPGREFATRRTP
ncbi:hypothetical protein F4556_007116 [Kitasatospora gansuensis]|uniref:Phosphodiester glycosidase domain-containing protein n=2 Tax=Kitasatospora gansuensis TaxID=258050 RepID=A0A7W7SLR0_9ACTN|nr:hypothetical protein [Kitasatospora gansuensis]